MAVDYAGRHARPKLVLHCLATQELMTISGSLFQSSFIAPHDLALAPSMDRGLPALMHALLICPSYKMTRGGTAFTDPFSSPKILLKLLNLRLFKAYGCRRSYLSLFNRDSWPGRVALNCLRTFLGWPGAQKKQLPKNGTPSKMLHDNFIE